MKIFLEKGLSLVELMLAVSIGGGVALLGSKLISDQVTNQNYIQSKGEINKMISLAQQNLAVKEACNKTFSIFQYDTDFSGEVALPAILNAQGNPVLKSDNYQSFDLDLSVTDFKTNAGVSLSKNLKKVNLKFTFKTSSILPKKNTTNSEITLFMSIDGNKNGQGYQPTDKWKCGEIFNDSKTLAWERLCADLGSDFATWDNINKVCKINEFKCPAGQIPTGLSKLGVFICKPAVEAIDLNQMIDTSTVDCEVGVKDYIKIIVESGKYKIICSEDATL
jgi:type II secretory pathway pseudopilin PulG